MYLCYIYIHIYIHTVCNIICLQAAPCPPGPSAGGLCPSTAEQNTAQQMGNTRTCLFSNYLFSIYIYIHLYIYTYIYIYTSEFKAGFVNSSGAHSLNMKICMYIYIYICIYTYIYNI